MSILSKEQVKQLVHGNNFQSVTDVSWIVKYSNTLTQLLTFQQEFFYHCGLADCYAMLRKMEVGSFEFNKR